MNTISDGLSKHSCRVQVLFTTGVNSWKGQMLSQFSKYTHCSLIVDSVQYDLTFTGLQVRLDLEEGTTVNIDMDDLDVLLVKTRLQVWLDLKPNYTLLTTNCVHFVQSCLGLPVHWQTPQELFIYLTNK